MLILSSIIAYNINIFFVKGCDNMKTLNKIALILCIIGGINWGAIGLFQFDIVAWIFGGQDSPASRIVYILVFLAALWCISIIFSDIKEPDISTKDNEIPDIGIN